MFNLKSTIQTDSSPQLQINAYPQKSVAFCISFAFFLVFRNKPDCKNKRQWQECVENLDKFSAWKY